MAKKKTNMPPMPYGNKKKTSMSSSKPVPKSMPKAQGMKGSKKCP